MAEKCGATKIVHELVWVCDREKHSTRRGPGDPPAYSHRFVVLKEDEDEA